MVATKSWAIEQRVERNPYDIQCLLRKDVTKYPNGAEKMEKGLWNAAVLRKQEYLSQLDMPTQILEVNARYTLYSAKSEQEAVNGIYKAAMTPGKQYRYTREGVTEILPIEETLFSELFALQSAEYRKLFQSASLQLPYGPLAPVIYVITSDDQIVLSVRGAATPKYPGARWGIGGDIDDPNKNVGQHTSEEFQDETGIHIQPQLTLGVVFDEVLRKHDLPMIANANVSYEKIMRHDEYVVDVADLTPVPASEKGLSDYLRKHSVDSLDANDQRWIGNLSAPATAGLYLLGMHLHGLQWAQNTLDKLPYKEIQE